MTFHNFTSLYSIYTTCYNVLQNPDVTDDEPPANETERRFFQAADKPIPDISFLGKKVQAMCKGLKTYWLFPSDEMPPAGMNGSMGDEGDEEAEADGTVGKLYM